MAEVQAKDKVITVELLGKVAEEQKKYIDAAVEGAKEELGDSQLVAASEAEIADIISKFNVAED